MLDAIVHRGPDDGFSHAAAGYTLGARRLSIVDLEGGRQPLCNEDGTVWVAQNGEIYNFPELRERLRAAGHSFRSRCDTETLVHLYEEKGLEGFALLEGMYAFALYDEGRRTGILVRDRVGKKPLYYLEHKGCLWFASEIKSLLRVPGFERCADWRAIHHFLSYKHVPAPYTAFEGIRSLPPASILVWSNHRIQRLETYWRPGFLPGPERPQEELVDELLALLRAAVRRRLISDVPIGFFLSGGLDSSLTTCLAAELSDTRIKTFTLSYSEESTTDGKRQDVQCARLLARLYGTEHHEETIDFADFPSEFSRIISHFDEPFSGVVSTYFLARLIGRHVKVALSGDGADELFGSYLSHRLAQPIAHYASLKAAGGQLPSGLADFEGRPGYLEQLYSPHDWEWRYRLLTFADAEKTALYTPEIRQLTAGVSTLEHLRACFTNLSAQDPLNRILEAEFRTIFPDQVLTFVDRLSMAHSLEVRAPFLDRAFVEFACALPQRWKIRDGVNKYLLKQAALMYLPKEVVSRPKEGFVMPVNRWLLESLPDYVRDMLSSERLRSQGYFDAAGVSGLLDAFYSGQGALANKVLSLVAFQVWHDTCLRANSLRPVSVER